MGSASVSTPQKRASLYYCSNQGLDPTLPLFSLT